MTVDVDKKIRIVQFVKLWGTFKCGNLLKVWEGLHIYVTVAIPVTAGGPWCQQWHGNNEMVATTVFNRSLQPGFGKHFTHLSGNKTYLSHWTGQTFWVCTLQTL